MGGRLQPESLDEQKAVAKRGEIGRELYYAYLDKLSCAYYYYSPYHGAFNEQNVNRFRRWRTDWLSYCLSDPASKAEVGGHNVHDDVDVSGL